MKSGIQRECLRWVVEVDKQWRLGRLHAHVRRAPEGDVAISQFISANPETPALVLSECEGAHSAANGQRARIEGDTPDAGARARRAEEPTLVGPVVVATITRFGATSLRVTFSCGRVGHPLARHVQSVVRLRPRQGGTCASHARRA